MRYEVAVIRLWQWLLCDYLLLLRQSLFVSAEKDFALTETDSQILERELTADIAKEWLACSLNTVTCPIAAYGHELAELFKTLRDKFDSCLGRRCNYIQYYCGQFWMKMFEPLENLRLGCGEWPPSCQNLYLQMDAYRNSEDYGLKVMCSLIHPGAGLARKPNCRALAKSTAATETSLTACSGMEFDKCVTYFCGLYSDFFWRMRPSNLQKENDAAPFTQWPKTYVLEGCESVIDTPFNEQDCPYRRDIQGICECVCKEFPNMPAATLNTECPANVDAYLLFGRFNVKDVILEPTCEDSLCSLLDASRARCPAMELPDMAQCKALQLSLMSTDPDMENCPWLTNSGEDGVLECLDGYRCNVETESWACCFSHKGRARCPRDRPDMCSSVCSGALTEYCCEEPGRCDAPRPCSPILANKQWYVVPTTVETTTLPPLASSSKEEDGGFKFRLPPGSWVWLLLIIPFFCGICCICLWRRWYKAAMFVVPHKSIVVEEIDGEGHFSKVKKKEQDDLVPAKNKLQVRIVVEELPSTKPLGLELFETKVNRVHAAGSQWGWQVGDNIIQVGGHPVHTFEEIWARIQIERDRLPCTFVVEREVQAATYIDNIRGQQVRIEDGSSEASGKIVDSRTASIPGSRVASKLADSESRLRLASKVSVSEHADSPTSSKLDSRRNTSKLADGESRRNTSKLPDYRTRSGSQLSSAASSMGTGSHHELDPEAAERERQRLLRFQHILDDCGSVDCNAADGAEMDMEAVANQLAMAVEVRDRKRLRTAVQESVIAGLPAVQVKLAQDVLLELDQAHRMERKKRHAKKEESESSEEEDDDDPKLSIDWWLENADMPVGEGALDNWEQWLQLEDVPPEPPLVPTWQIERAKGFKFEKTFEKSKSYPEWLHDAQELVKSQEPEGGWRTVAGFIDTAANIPLPQSIPRRKMTVDEAKQICTRLRGCKGFCHTGPPTSEPVDIVFKSSSTFIRADESKWTTYLRPEVTQKSGSVNEDRKPPSECKVCGGKCDDPIDPETKKEDIGKKFCKACRREVTDKSILFGGYRGPENEVYHPHCLNEEARQLSSMIGEPLEWICNVCRRANKIDEKIADPKCSVCGAKRGYMNTKLADLAEPKLELHEYGTNKALDPRVRFKKDACGRFVYEVVQ